MKTVKAWYDKKIIPTYEVSAPELYPVFLEKRVYQASSGKVYPHPVVEAISDTKVDKAWEVILLENQFLKIMILPALGGRIQMAYDKIRERHFVYYNQVIKPALVGLTGPWISGGIEFNWPQHHRPSTYEPVEHHIEKNQDGSITVWVSEVERMFRTKGMAGFTLYPDKAYLEIKVKLYNRTPHPQTFLWWANPAVKVNDHYQSVFPPDVHAVFDHGKRDVSTFPIAKGTYYKVDYSPGTDISRYKNIPVPTSYMAITSEYDFIGGYENDSKGGLLHVANHHISPGKKQWTWGNSDFGKAWDRNLTDEDGPYIELMCGVYTDNQPDFSWLHPYEEKSFEQYFMPYYNVGTVKNATKNALVNMELQNGELIVKCHVTAVYEDAQVEIRREDQLHHREQLTLRPDTVYERKIEIPEVDLAGYLVAVKDAAGRVLVDYLQQEDQPREVPDPAQAIEQPEDITSVEQLYLSGLHLEQYRHATYDPRSYYLEAIRRSPGDVRNNNALGLWYLKRGRFAKAIAYFDRAIKTLTGKNPNPYDGEPYFHRATALLFSGKEQAAYDSFYKACWNASWQDAGYFQLARLHSKKKELAEALSLVGKSLSRNTNHHKARHLQTVLLRLEGRTSEALEQIKQGLALDYFSFGLHYEQYLLTEDQKFRQELISLLQNRVHNYLEYALDYASMGRYQEGIGLLELYLNDQEKVYPMVHYFLGSFHQALGDQPSAMAAYRRAASMPMDYCFPNRLEEVLILQQATQMNPEDGRAHYYLGNYWYANQQYEHAKKAWETAARIAPDNPICFRNLALLYYNKAGNAQAAKNCLEQAIALDGQSPRLQMEYDQFNKKTNQALPDRFAHLQRNLSLVRQRDDLYLEYVSMLNFQNLHEEALAWIMERKFHPWEGGEGKVVFQYLTSLIEQGKAQLEKGRYREAVACFERAKVYPENLGEGKLYGTRENDIDYWLGCAYDKMDRQQEARHYWQLAAKGPDDPNPAIFYNDQQPDKIFYKALALKKLGEADRAEQIFNNLIAYGKSNLGKDVKLDYFAVSLPDLLIWEEDLNRRNDQLCQLLLGMGYLGLGDQARAAQYFKAVLETDHYHLPAFLHLQMAEQEMKS